MEAQVCLCTEKDQPYTQKDAFLEFLFNGWRPEWLCEHCSHPRRSSIKPTHAFQQHMTTFLLFLTLFTLCTEQLSLSSLTLEDYIMMTTISHPLHSPPWAVTALKAQQWGDLLHYGARLHPGVTAPLMVQLAGCQTFQMHFREKGWSVRAGFDPYCCKSSKSWLCPDNIKPAQENKCVKKRIYLKRIRLN